jgi:2-polyprenyl-6-methoxyphenol hydroxylase-like FAD-dependent oxidoreductase
MRIACVGAGPAGLYFSILVKLRNPRQEVTVYERTAADSSDGWGITVGARLVERLHANDPVCAREIERAALRWRDQFIHIRGEQVEYRGSLDIYNLNRPHLVRLLAARALDLGVRMEYGAEITSQDQLPDSDVIVAADGADSRLRSEAGPFGTRTSASPDKYIWLGTDKPFGTFSYYFTETSHGWIWASGYGLQSDLSTFVVHCGPLTWSGLDFDTIPMRDGLALIKDLFKDQLGDHRLIGQVADESDARWHSFRTVTNERWHDGRVVLVGDSAHTTHFSAGLGTTLALEDAIALADSLGRHGGVGQALDEYAQRRRTAIRRRQAEARRSGQWFANISRYIDRPPAQFATLLHARRSALQPLVSPWAYYLGRRLRLRAAPIMNAVLR